MPSDEALTLFLKRAPLGADRFVVTAMSHAGEHVVQDRTAKEAIRAHVMMANSTIMACDRWAHSEGRECRFRATWQQGERVLASHQWRAGQGDPQALNGTVESFLSQVQRHLENREQNTYETQSTQLEAWKTLSGAQNRRIEALEKENDHLRERLRRVDDVSSELAIEHAKADIESRGRTVDILENRVLPIVQAYVAQQLQKELAANSGNGSGVAAASSGQQKPNSAGSS